MQSAIVYLISFALGFLFGFMVAGARTPPEAEESADQEQHVEGVTSRERV